VVAAARVIAAEAAMSDRLRFVPQMFIVVPFEQKDFNSSRDAALLNHHPTVL
jgi:hypothetical protein